MTLNLGLWAAMAFSALGQAGPSQGAKDDALVFKTVIENTIPYFDDCYQNARDGGADYALLRPCNLALENEALTPRLTAIAHVNRGVIRYNLGDYEDAIEDFSAALDLDIHVKAKVLVNRGLSYEAANAERLARIDYESALAFNPDNETARRRLEELKKPIYERSKLPSRINAGVVAAPSAGI
ncbi:tetratricopeptide repeat protein [Hyphococcus sp.]|jgi:tetratricopeptide (TPR) repeat protein|uniref:tetratricopeptide repeat protein n=1 Tax=Hyphococcus sp. TaxID=2038636 RepID=UPI003D0E8F74